MQTFVRTLLASSALIGATAAASAADYSPPPAYAPSWTGFYIGGQFGGGAVVHEVDIPANGPIFNFNGIGGEGFLGGGMAGFNYQIGPKVVIGAQADFSWTDIESEASLNIGALNANASIRAQWLLGVSGRLGYLLNDNALLYVIGGYSAARFKASAGIAGVGGASLKEDVDGFHIGGGLEGRITDSVTLRAEYRYIQFQEEEFVGGLIGVEPSMHVGTVGLAWNFGWPGGEAHVSPTADYEPMPEATVASWSGLYFGGFIGGGALVHDIDIPANGPILEIDGIGGEGILGGPMAGLNYQIGSFVIGAQFDAAFTGIETEASLNLAPLLTASAEVQLDYMLSASARVGYLLNPDTLAYVIGGYTHGHFSADLNVGGIVALNASDEKSFAGFHVGGGLEAKLTDTLTARAEYRYTQFGEEDFFGGLVGVSPSIHTGTVGLAWTFFSL
ncbi:MAG: outer membrane protein [Parvibaculaceae bacterium]